MPTLITVAGTAYRDKRADATSRPLFSLFTIKRCRHEQANGQAWN